MRKTYILSFPFKCRERQKSPKRGRQRQRQSRVNVDQEVREKGETSQETIKGDGGFEIMQLPPWRGDPLPGWPQHSTERPRAGWCILSLTLFCGQKGGHQSTGLQRRIRRGLAVYLMGEGQGEALIKRKLLEQDILGTTNLHWNLNHPSVIHAFSLNKSKKIGYR